MMDFYVATYTFTIKFNSSQEQIDIVASHYLVEFGIANFYDTDKELIYSISEFNSIERCACHVFNNKTHLNCNFTVYGSIKLINDACDQLISSNAKDPKLFLYGSDIKLIDDFRGFCFIGMYRGVSIKSIEGI